MAQPDMPRIVLVLPQAAWGGAELFVARLLRALPEASTASLVVLGSPPDGADPFADVPVDVTYLRAGSLHHAARAVRDLRDLIEAADADILQSFLYKADLTATLAWRGMPARHRPALVWGVRNTALPRSELLRQAPYLAALAAWSRQPGIHKVAPSARAVSYHVDTWRFGPDAWSVIPNFVSPWAAALERPASRPADTRDPLRIGLLSRYAPGKGHELLLAAAELLHRQLDRPVTVAFAGRGVVERRDDFARMAPSVTVDVSDLLVDPSTWMAGLDIYAQASTHWEAFPNALLEAACSGVPVVTTDAGEAASFVRTPARIVDPATPAAMAAAVAEVVATDSEALEKECVDRRSRLLDEYSTEGVVNRFRALWEAVASESRVPR